MENSPKSTQPGHFRQFMESLLCLVLAVIVFRLFEVEGYMISTGSMAPSLLGFHKQVECPSCGYAFPFGVSYRDSETASPSAEEDPETDFRGSDTTGRQLCTCPNCGQRGIEISGVPRNQGDQLLVFREAYWLRPPKRWEVIVFRNPYESTQAYVKRLVGLPGETVAVRHGDVYVNGEICRKNYETQTATRILVYDHNFEPDDTDWKPRWQPDAGWQRQGSGFESSGIAPPREELPQRRRRESVHGLRLAQPSDHWAWLVYGHYFRSGGTHTSRVILPKSSAPSKWPHDLLPLQYNPETREISLPGVMSADLKRRLAKVSEDADFQQGVEELFTLSQFSPVMDGYGYNRGSHAFGHNQVRDLMVSFRLSLPTEQPPAERPRQFAVDFSDEDTAFRMLWDFASREVRLLINPEQNPGQTPVRVATLNTDWVVKPCQIEFSLFDRQVVIAINGEEIFDAWPMPFPYPERDAPRFPVRIGTSGVRAIVDDLKLYRDVYYTSKGDEKPLRLKADELFVLGDNSPVSLDSRRWENGAVPMRLMLGKPFIVHLPSRQLNLRIGETTRNFRIPDFSRIRYIR